MKTKLFMMIGIVASGKSTIAEKIATENHAQVVESDAYREAQEGDASIQGDNTKLFGEIHNDIISLLSDGVSVVFDATNISRKHRVAFLSKLYKLNVDRIAILCMTQYETCIVQNKMRERQVPEHVIARMWKTFNVPVYAEGWDDIRVVYNYDDKKYTLSGYLSEIENFNQDNPHHSRTLGGHVKAVSLNLEDEPFGMYMAGLLHDNGKRYTKVFTDVRGNPSHSFVDVDGNTRKMAHYYQHAEVGAYEAMFYLRELDWFFDNDDTILFIAGVILYHMRPYQLKSDKSVNKLKTAIGNEMLDAVMILNKADIEAH